MATHTLTPAVAAARASRATSAVGALGIATSVFVVSRAFASWQVGGSRAHTVSLLGGRLSYPAANAAAIGVLALALLGATVTATAILAAVRELRAARRFDACLRAATRPEAPPARPAAATALAADAIVLEGGKPQAFCAGLLRPRVYITTGSLERLDEAALAAVLEHERHHARRRDPLRLASGRVLSRALFFLLASLFVFALVAGIAVLGSRFASGTATLAPPLLSRQPCVIMLALVPAGAGFLGLRAAGRMRAAWLAASSRERFRGPRSIA
jgi:Zn-dependent protease with chaperone function